MSAEGQRPSKNSPRVRPKSNLSHSSKTKLNLKQGYKSNKSGNWIANVFFILGYPLYYILLSVFRFLIFLSRSLQYIFAQATIRTSKLPRLHFPKVVITPPTFFTS